MAKKADKIKYYIVSQHKDADLIDCMKCLTLEELKVSVEDDFSLHEGSSLYVQEVVVENNYTLDVIAAVGELTKE